MEMNHLNVDHLKLLIDTNISSISSYLLKCFDYITIDVVRQTNIEVIDAPTENSKNVVSKISLKVFDLMKDVESVEDFMNNSVNGLIKSLVDLINENNFTKITKIETIVADEPDKLTLGWVVFCFAE